MAKYTIGDIFEGEFPITQYYNENPQLYTMFAVPGHEGIDFGTPTGTPVLAPFDGIILRDVYGDKDYGNFLVVWDPVQKCALWYCHLQNLATQPGDKVRKGQVLGHTNNTGHSTGPHLHVNFVETDEQGNRLNRDNGKQGFLNLMDSNLVEWKLGNQPQPTPQPEVPEPLPLPNPGYAPTYAGQTVEHDGMIYRSHEQDGKLLWTVSAPSVTTSEATTTVVSTNTDPVKTETTTSTQTIPLTTPPETPQKTDESVQLENEKDPLGTFFKWLWQYIKKYFL